MEKEEKKRKGIQVPVAFGKGLEEKIYDFAGRKDSSFADATRQLCEAALDLFYKTGSLNVELLVERMKNAESEVKFLRQAIKRLPGN